MSGSAQEQCLDERCLSAAATQAKIRMDERRRATSIGWHRVGARVIRTATMAHEASGSLSARAASLTGLAAWLGEGWREGWMDRTLLHRFCFVHRSAVRDDMLVTQWKASAAAWMRRRVASFTNQDQRRLPSRSPRKCRYWDSPTWGKATKQGTRLAIRRQCCVCCSLRPGPLGGRGAGRGGSYWGLREGELGVSLGRGLRCFESISSVARISAHRAPQSGFDRDDQE